MATIRKGKTSFLLAPFEFYRRSESIETWFLKKHKKRYLQTNRIFRKSNRCQTTRKKTVATFVFPIIKKRILELKRPIRAIQESRNIWSTIATHIQNQQSIKQISNSAKLTTIARSSQSFQDAVVGNCLGSSLDWLKTRGPPGKPISEISKEPVRTQGEKQDASTLIWLGEPAQVKLLRKGLQPSQYQRSGAREDELVTIWENLSSYPSVYKGV